MGQTRRHHTRFVAPLLARDDMTVIFDVRLTPGASSNYSVFKVPATLYVQKMMPDGIAFVLTSSNERGGVPSAKKRFPVPNMTG